MFSCELQNETCTDANRLPDNAIDQFCEQAVKCGMDIFRVFDALNDPGQIEVGIKAVRKAGGVAEGTVCYSGDSEYPYTCPPINLLAPASLHLGSHSTVH